MKALEARELFHEIAVSFFKGYNVIYAHQSRIAKPQIPLVVITSGNVHRPQAENSLNDEGVISGYYLSRMPITVDLFTNGKALKDGNGKTYAYANSAMDEILDFADYLNSPKCVALCNTHDVSILIETDAQDLTGVVNDTNYEYRSRLEVLFSFTQKRNQSDGDMGYFSNIAIESI